MRSARISVWVHRLGEETGKGKDQRPSSGSGEFLAGAGFRMVTSDA